MFGVLLGGERERALEELQSLAGVETECAFPRQQRVAAGLRRDLVGERGVAVVIASSSASPVWYASTSARSSTRSPAFVLEPGGGLNVLGRTLRAWDLRVGDVADEDVPEAELVLILHRRLPRGTYELLARELVHS